MGSRGAATQDERRRSTVGPMVGAALLGVSVPWGLWAVARPYSDNQRQIVGFLAVVLGSVGLVTLAVAMRRRARVRRWSAAVGALVVGLAVGSVFLLSQGSQAFPNRLQDSEPGWVDRLAERLAGVPHPRDRASLLPIGPAPTEFPPDLPPDAESGPFDDPRAPDDCGPFPTPTDTSTPVPPRIPGPLCP